MKSSNSSARIAAITAPDWPALFELAQRQAERLGTLWERVLHNAEPDDIHDLRVCTRRLQQMLDLIEPPPARSRLARKTRKRIRRCRRVLGDLRNRDVVLAHIQATPSAHHGNAADTRAALAERLAQGRDQLRQMASSQLRSLDIERIQEALDMLFAADAQGGAPLGAHLSRALETTSERFDEALDHLHDHPADADIHAVRIAAKSLRYVLELFDELHIPGVGDRLKWLRRVQQQLGDWHDLVIQEQLLVEMMADPRFITEHLDICAGIIERIRQLRAEKAKRENKLRALLAPSAQRDKMQAWVTAQRV